MPRHGCLAAFRDKLQLLSLVLAGVPRYLTIALRMVVDDPANPSICFSLLLTYCSIDAPTLCQSLPTVQPLPLLECIDSVVPIDPSRPTRLGPISSTTLQTNLPASSLPLRSSAAPARFRFPRRALYASLHGRLHHPIIAVYIPCHASFASSPHSDPLEEPSSKAPHDCPSHPGLQ